MFLELFSFLIPSLSAVISGPRNAVLFSHRLLLGNQFMFSGSSTGKPDSRASGWACLEEGLSQAPGMQACAVCALGDFNGRTNCLLNSMPPIPYPEGALAPFCLQLDQMLDFWNLSSIWVHFLSLQPIMDVPGTTLALRQVLVAGVLSIPQA